MIPIRYHRRQVRIELCPHGSQRLRLRRRLPLRWPGRDVRILAALERARRTVRGNDRGATVSDAYLSPEDWARRRIDGQLEAAGWDVQSRDEVNVAAGLGVAVRDRRGMPDPDCLLFVDGKACGTYEAKKDGHTLTGVEGQSSRYEESIPDGADTWGRPLRFAYEGTGYEVQFTDRSDPEPRSRPVFAVHRPETLRGWLREAVRLPAAPTLRARFRQMPDRSDPQLWPHQREAIAAIE